jgi:hypothetical protein
MPASDLVPNGGAEPVICERPVQESLRDGAHLTVPIKANQPTLLDRLHTLPWAQGRTLHPRPRSRPARDPHPESRHRRHPRRPGFPHVAQAILITGTRMMSKKPMVSRRVSERDGRGRVIALTSAGRDLIDAAFSDHMANVHRPVGQLTSTEAEQLATLLGRWLTHYETNDVTTQ